MTDNLDVALTALYRLGGDAKWIDTEDVALECFKISPERFSWKKYPEYPESEPARSALFDARKAKNGSLVRGDNRRGWILTPAGIDRARDVLQTVAPSVANERRSDRQILQRQLNALEQHPAFLKFTTDSSCNSVARYEFADFLRCTADAPANVLRERLDLAKSAAHSAGRQELLAFIACCEEKFQSLLTETS